MGDELVERAVRVKDDAVGARRGAGVDGVAGQDGELVPGGGGREGEALVVVVLVRVAAWFWVSLVLVWEACCQGRVGLRGDGEMERALTEGASGLLERVALVLSGRYLGLRVAVGAAGVVAGSLLDGGCGGGGGEEKGDDGGDELCFVFSDHCCVVLCVGGLKLTRTILSDGWACCVMRIELGLRLWIRLRDHRDSTA